jgi:hypothetical protein
MAKTREKGQCKMSQELLGGIINIKYESNENNWRQDQQTVAAGRADLQP